MHPLIGVILSGLLTYDLITYQQRKIGTIGWNRWWLFLYDNLIDGRVVYDDIMKATNDFRVVYGNVYKATLQTNNVVAVKKFHSSSENVDR